MKALIITTHIEHKENLNLNENYDTVICADAGYIRAQELGIKPNYIIGDYDSSELPKSNICDNITILPCEKDMTDSEAALDMAISKGAEHIDILGGLGGRFDHTMGNLGILAKYSTKTAHLSMFDGQNRVFMLDPGTHTLNNLGYSYIGFISYGDKVTNLSIKDLKYELEGFELDNRTSISVSNEFVSDKCLISFDTGRILVIYSNDI